MFRLFTLISCWGVAVAGMPAVAQMAAAPAALRQRGTKVVNELPRLSPGEKGAIHVLIKLGPEMSVGYSSITLEARQDGDELIYEYVNDTGMRFGTGARMLARIEAKLKPTFEPIDILSAKRRVDPEGEVQAVIERAIIGTEKVKLFGRAGEQSASKEVDRAQAPFIYGIETFAQQLKLSEWEPFIVGEFNISNGQAYALRFTLDTWEDGTPTIVTYDAEGTGSYQFWFDELGRLVRFGEPSMPFLFVRTTAEQIAPLQKEIGKLEEIEPIGEDHADGDDGPAGAADREAPNTGDGR